MMSHVMFVCVVYLHIWMFCTFVMALSPSRHTLSPYTQSLLLAFIPVFSLTLARWPMASSFYQWRVIFTARKRSLGQGNIFSSVCQEFCSRGGGTWAGTPPGQVHPPGRYTPQAGTPPWAGTPPGRYTPLGRYTPQAGTPPGRYTPRAGTPQSSACWEIQATSGQHASY